MQKARDLDAKIAKGEQVGSLAGLPISLKDNIAIAGQKMSCGSASLQDYRSPFDATVVERLEAEDAIIVGKTNLDEFWVPRVSIRILVLLKIRWMLAACQEAPAVERQ